MTAEPKPAGWRFALLQNGSRFSRRVLSGLLAGDCAPEMLVLPEFPPARPAQSALLEVTTAPPRLLPQASEIEITYAPRSRQAQFVAELRQRELDFLLVACWPYLIDERVVASIKSLALNLHPSLLPDYPGPDPIGAQLAAGETRLGVSLHRLSPVFDQGEVVAQARLPNTAAVHDRASIEAACAELGCKLFIESLCAYDAGRYGDAQSGYLAGGNSGR